ncbi:hypothetical protein [Sodalis sp.]|uniref:hypothetical protein n=1 Tax=Sodalis sp. (in: enterobacteria) TaxID=1898979 RepID=UPI00387355FA
MSARSFDDDATSTAGGRNHLCASCEQFLNDALINHPAWPRELAAQPPRLARWLDYARLLASPIAAVDDEAGLVRELRLFQRRMLVRIGWA